MKFSPFPWKNDHGVVNDDNGRCLWESDPADGYRDGDLIAAAPEMYELLKDLYVEGNTCKANVAIGNLLSKVEGE